MFPKWPLKKRKHLGKMFLNVSVLETFGTETFGAHHCNSFLRPPFLGTELLTISSLWSFLPFWRIGWATVTRALLSISFTLLGPRPPSGWKLLSPRLFSCIALSSKFEISFKVQSQVQITEWVYFWDSGQNNGIYSIPLFYNFWPQILEKGKIA